MKKVVAIIIGILFVISVGCVIYGYIYNVEKKEYELLVETENNNVSKWLKDAEDKKVILFLKPSYCQDCDTFLERVNTVAKARNYVVYDFDANHLSQDNLNIITNKFKNYYLQRGPFIGAIKNGVILGGSNYILDSEELSDYFDCWDVDKKDNDNDNDKVSKWKEEVIKNSEEKIVTVISFPYCQSCNKYKQVVTELSKEKNFKLYYFDAETMSKEDLDEVLGLYNIAPETEIDPNPITLFTFIGDSLSLSRGYKNKYDFLETLDQVDLQVIRIKESNKVEIDEEDKRDIQIKKDDDYEYAYYYDEDWDFTNEVLYFKINGRKIFDDSDAISEILSVKKYNDFMAIETYFANPGGSDSKYLNIYDYSGNKLFVSEDVSILDLNSLTSEDNYKKWNTGYMNYDSYSYNEKNNILEIKYKFNIKSVIGEVNASIPWEDRSEMPFCVESKRIILYDTAKISMKFNNKKFEDRTVLDKTLFNIKNYSEEDRDLYYTECDKK